ncbi:hypothetical protein EON82_16910 [bacterium]|nr:MAG: hypothetical protein EON82_16910 [bacterium]
MFALLLIFASLPALAWKPQTHIYAANRALELVYGGSDSVVINGRPYAVDSRIASAIRNYPAYYRAGVVGPDGFPDIYVGQAFIHPDTRANNGTEPVNSGDGHSFSYEWLRHVYQAGWKVYNDNPGTAKGEKILAFTYGYLTHAAGDMWAHSFVNDFANGVFPSVTEFSLLPIGIRHIVVEAYVGAATPSTDLTLMPADGDLSGFIYNTLMVQSARGGFVDSAGNDAPKLGRGAIFDFFFGLRDDLNGVADTLLEFPYYLDPLLVAAGLYCDEWADDIDDGLGAWPEFSRQVSVELFQENDFDGAKTVAGDFLSDHILSMIGVPDWIVGLLALIDEVLEPFNDLIEPLKDAAKEFVFYMIQQTTGIDLPALKEYVLTPQNHINEGAIGLGPNTSTVIDGLMGRTTPMTGNFNPDTFAAMKNTITLSKMILLSPTELNKVLYDNRVGDLYAASVSNSDKENVMLGFIHTLDGHQQWRKSTSKNYINSPTGTVLSEGMPLWVDCLARDRVFRTLFADWQNGSSNFPHEGEMALNLSNTPVPDSTLTINGPAVVVSGKQFVGPSTTFTVDGKTNYFWASNEIRAQGQITPGGSLQSALSSLVVGPIAGADGAYTVSHQGIGLCSDGPLHPGTLNSSTVYLDATPPTIGVPVPTEGQVLDINTPINLAFNAVDAGSGVKTLTATLDGAPILDGTKIDPFFLDAGVHTIVVSATDAIGNASNLTRKFEIHATILGLRAAVIRAYELGLITKPITQTALLSQLDSAQKSFLKGDLKTAKNKVAAARNLVEGQLGHGVDTVFGTRFIGWCNDLIARP